MEIKNKYNNSCIYKIWKHNFIYIGSTCDFKRRMIEHKSICNNINSTKYNFKIYQTIRLHGGWDLFEKLVVQNVCCENRKELREIEGEFIKNIGTINCQISGRTKKQYREDNRDKIAEYTKQYYENNRNKIAEYTKQYREDNRDKILERKKQKIICPICSVLTTKQHIKRHQKSKKCSFHDPAHK